MRTVMVSGTTMLPEPPHAEHFSPISPDPPQVLQIDEKRMTPCERSSRPVPLQAPHTTRFFVLFIPVPSQREQVSGRFTTSRVDRPWMLSMKEILRWCSISWPLSGPDPRDLPALPKNSEKISRKLLLSVP